MKRYTRLIRKLLEYAEQQKTPGFFPAPECSEFSWQVVHYHIGLCLQAGYLTAQNIAAGEEPAPRYEIGNLTWQGHEALDKLRA